ncbi:HAD family hydrolase [Georgenia alba]|uniref:HAD family hydrolase n=1 Tax=Georgenia alba TaxID=2233858 RepID=A0ABW2QB51_9MICO
MSRRTDMQRHVLLDADGVLQRPAADFASELNMVVRDGAEEWLRETFRRDGDVVTGRAEVVPALRGLLQEKGADHDATEVHQRLWCAIQVNRSLLAEVPTWQNSGLKTHLATNQDPGRARFMKATLGYERVLDGTYYSCDLGVAKPDPAYFDQVLADLRADPDDVLFIDDGVGNVEVAQSLGICGLRWQWSGTESESVDLLLQGSGCLECRGPLSAGPRTCGHACGSLLAPRTRISPARACGKTYWR